MLAFMILLGSWASGYCLACHSAGGLCAMTLELRLPVALRMR